MRANRFLGTFHPSAYRGCVQLIFALALAQGMTYAAFTAGPSVRVSLQDAICGFGTAKVEFRWSADFAGTGKVEVFENPDGTGITYSTTSSLVSNDQTITFCFSGPATTYYFRITHTDYIRPDLTNSPPPYPPFFTGAQAIGNVFVDADFKSAVISWDANVIGYGSVVYGTTGLTQGPVEDSFNITRHAIELTGLLPGRTYQFRVSNKHAIDRTSLADAMGQFTTGRQPADVSLTQPQADPRVIGPNERSTLRVRTVHQGQPVSGVVVWFAIDPGSRGRATFDGGALSAPATTDANGVASVQITGTGSGLIQVNVTSAQALNSLAIPLVVR